MTEEEKAIKWCKAQKGKYIKILLDLYQKEKTRNASMKKEIKLMKSININDNFISKELLESYKKELEETKKHLNSNCNKALMDFGIDLINHILEGETNDKLSL